MIKGMPRNTLKIHSSLYREKRERKGEREAGCFWNAGEHEMAAAEQEFAGGNGVAIRFGSLFYAGLS
jgi:hypothetical protein